MHKIWTIACREYIATVRTKAFLISLVLMPIMMCSGGLVSYITERMEDRSEKIFVVIDRTPGQQVLPRLQSALEYRNTVSIVDPKTGERNAVAFKIEPMEAKDESKETLNQQRLELSERAKKQEIVGFLEIGPEAMQPAWKLALQAALGQSEKKTEIRDKKQRASDPSIVRYQSKPTATGSREFYNWAMVEVSLALAGVERPKQEQRAFEPPIVSLGLSSRDPVTGEITDDEGIDRTTAPTLVALALVLLMFMIIMTGAMPLMQGVLEERLQKIADMLLGSVSPFQLMAGKLVGGVGVALTLAFFYVGGAYGAVVYYGYAEFVPVSLIVWFLFFLTFSLLMNGAAFMAVGAACNDMKDPQTLMLPVMMPLMLPLMMFGPMLKQPDGMLVRVMSFFPPATPMLMTARLAMSATMAWWEPILASVIMLLFTFAVVWAAGRIFRIGLLVQGKTPKLGEMLMWVFEA